MWFGRFLLWFFKPLAWLLFPFKPIGRENIPDTPGQPPLILCCNHISEIDPVFLEMCQKRHVFFMAKEEIFRSRLSSWFFGKQLGAFPVKRGAGDTGALDTATGRLVMDLFHTLHRDQGKTIVLITHNPELAQETERIITLSDGEIIGNKAGAEACI